MDSEGLTARLRDHLSDEHDIEVQEKSARFSEPMTSSGPGSRTEEPSRERGRFSGAQHRREEQTWAPEAGTAVPPRPQGMDWMRKALGTNQEAGGREEWARGQGYPAMMERPSERYTSPDRWRETEARAEGRVACPMCGQLLTGSDEGKLSARLETHFRDEHRLVSRIAQR